MGMDWGPIGWAADQISDLCIDTGGNDSCDTIAEQHPESMQHVVNAAGGVLSVNPITAFLPLDLEGHGVDPCSGWYTTGQVAMTAVDVAIPAHAGWTALNSGRGIGIGNTVRVARHQAHRAMPELAGGAVRQANWLQSHHAFRAHWHWTWRGVRNPGGM